MRELDAASVKFTKAKLAVEAAEGDIAALVRDHNEKLADLKEVLDAKRKVRSEASLKHAELNRRVNQLTAYPTALDEDGEVVMGEEAETPPLVPASLVLPRASERPPQPAARAAAGSTAPLPASAVRAGGRRGRSVSSRSPSPPGREDSRSRSGAEDPAGGAGGPPQRLGRVARAWSCGRWSHIPRGPPRS